MPRFLRWFAVAAMLCWCVAPVSSLAAPTEQKTIVVLSAEDLSTPFFNRLYVGLKAELKERLGEQANVFAENLDFVQFADAGYKSRLAAWLHDKYRDRKIDVIVAVGAGALAFVADSRSRLWSHVPVVFAALNKSALEKIVLTADETGIVTENRLGDMVRMVKHVLPRVRQLALVGNTPERDEYRPFFAEDLAALADRIEFIDLRGVRIEEVGQRLAALPKDAAIYYTRLTDDGSGRIFETQSALQTLLKSAQRPVFVDNAALIGSGALAALAADPGARGRQAADYVVKVIEGTPPSQLPHLRGTVGPIFDWRQIKAWHIGQAQLPAESSILFYEPTLWEKYRWHIGAILALILLQAALIGAVLVERRRREEAVRESRQRLAEIAHMNRNATATVYTAAVTHELNQPLAAILANAEAAELFMQQEPPALDEVRDILTDIRRDDQRASELVQRMRGWLKKSETCIADLDLNQLVLDVRSFLAGEAKMRQITINTQLAPVKPIVAGDRVQLQQVLINLILNSMDAVQNLPPVRRLITVRMSLPDPQHVEVAVLDQGPGFQSGTEQVFEAFYTTKAGGMGLGLAISEAIIKAHRGQITAQNASGGGAIVRFLLPLQEGAKT